MKRLKMRCTCCREDVELYRDTLSGPDHYRCGNCFEIIELDSLEKIAEQNRELERLDREREEILMGGV